MPLYEYRCNDCGHEFEIIQKFSDPVKRKCPECKGKLEKLLSKSSFKLKGGGWFDQGYGSGGSVEKKTAPKKDSSSTTTKKKKKSVAGDK